MSTHFYKHKIILDENFPLRSHLPLLNSKFNLRHIAKDLKHSGWSDDQVYKFAHSNRMIIVTFNYKDFVDYINLSHDTGIVGVSPNLPNQEIDKKLTSLFTKSTKKSLFGKLTYISGKTGSEND